MHGIRRLVVGGLLLAFGVSPAGMAMAAAATSPPPVSVSPAVLNFGSVEQYRVGSVQTFTVSATRTAVITLPDVHPFSPVGGTCPRVGARITLAPGASCTVDMGFYPTLARGYAIQMSLFWAVIAVGFAGVPTGHVPLSLVATSTPAPPAWTLSAPLAFGGQVRYTTSAPRTLTMTATRAAEIVGISRLSQDFVLLQTTCHLFEHFLTGESCTFTIAFAPQSAATFASAMEIDWRSEGFPLQVRANTFDTGVAMTGFTVPPGTRAAVDRVSYYSTTTQSEAPRLRAGQRVALLATVTPATGTTPTTGVVLFYDGITRISTAPLSSNGPLSYALFFTTMSAGTHIITAIYSGDRTFATVFSEALQVTVTN